MKDFLIEEERRSLRAKHRIERDGRIRDRMKAILLADKGWQYIKIAEALMIDDVTASKHIQDYLEEKKLKPENGGSTSRLDFKSTQELIKHLEENTYVKAEDVCAYVLKNYGVVYTVSGMTSWLKNHWFSYKQPKKVPAKMNAYKQESFVAYYEKLKKNTPEAEPILFIDGVHPTMATKVTHGWIRTGKEKLISATASRTRLNLLGFLNLSSMHVGVQDYKTLNEDSMILFLRHIRKLYPKATKIHIILDQGPYNTSKKVKEAAKEYGIILHYLPTYSPNLNPIERVWKVMNEYARNNRFFRSAKEFRSAIFDFFEVTWDRISIFMIDRINDNFQCLKQTS